MIRDSEKSPNSEMKKRYNVQMNGTQPQKVPRVENNDEANPCALERDPALTSNFFLPL